MSMLITNINGRFDKDGRHNDRNFDTNKAKHIDQERIKDDVYWTYTGETDKTFLEIEKEFYEKEFSEYLEYQNEKYKKQSHPEKCKTINEYYKGAYTSPEDKILQIGNINKHATGEELWECALEYQRKFDELYGDRCKILDMALHLDEATPHVHIRRVWIAENEEGYKKVSQAASLEMLGDGRPDMTKRSSKKNNNTVTFTKYDLKLFYDICKEKGLDVTQKETKQGKREHLTTEEYKTMQRCIDIGEQIEKQFGCYDKIKSKKSDQEYIEEMKEKVDNGEELTSNEALEFELRRQRIFAKKRGRLNQYQSDLMEYIEQIQEQNRREQTSSEEVKNNSITNTKGSSISSTISSVSINSIGQDERKEFY